MRMNKNLSLVVIVSLLYSTATFGRDQAMPTMYTPTTAGVTTTTMAKETIQTLGQQAEGNTNKGKGLANAGMAITAIGVAATCWNPSGAKMCKIFVAGLVATTMVRMFMGGASGTSSGTVAAVTTTADPNAPTVTTDKTPSPNTAPDYTQEPDYKNAIKEIKKLTDNGWKIDTGKGTIVDPKGNKYNASVASNPSAASAAGIGASEMKAFENAMAKVPALAAEKTKSADGDSAGYEDAAGGGGAQTAASADSAGAAYGGLGLGSTGPKLGIDRDPAQVAGMKKDFNGSPIGVSADSLFQMVDRRYDLHHKNGSFLSH
jgi:hypothetical protein